MKRKKDLYGGGVGWGGGIWSTRAGTMWWYMTGPIRGSSSVRKPATPHLQSRSQEGGVLCSAHFFLYIQDIGP